MRKQEYAAHRGCSPPYISKLIRTGRLAAPALLDDGLINVALADQMLGDGPLAEARGTDPEEGGRPASYTAARAREVDAKASLAEMELARRRKEMLHRDAVSMAAQGIFERAVAAVLKVPSDVSLDLATLTDPAAIEDKLSGALKVALWGLHEEFLADAERRTAA